MWLLGELGELRELRELRNGGVERRKQLTERLENPRIYGIGDEQNLAEGGRNRVLQYNLPRWMPKQVEAVRRSTGFRIRDKAFE